MKHIHFIQMNENRNAAMSRFGTLPNPWNIPRPFKPQHLVGSGRWHLDQRRHVDSTSGAGLVPRKPCPDVAVFGHHFARVSSLRSLLVFDAFVSLPSLPCRAPRVWGKSKKWDTFHARICAVFDNSLSVCSSTVSEHSNEPLFRCQLCRQLEVCGRELRLKAKMSSPDKLGSKLWVHSLGSFWYLLLEGLCRLYVEKVLEVVTGGCCSVDSMSVRTLPSDFKYLTFSLYVFVEFMCKCSRLLKP